MGTYNGKIGRLPRELREQVNQRLDDGQPAKIVLNWLNALPDVQTLLAAEFGGKPINEPNITYWRQGGHQLWLREQMHLTLLRELAGARQIQSR